MTEAPQGVPVLSVKGLSKQFGGTHALRDVELTVMAGEAHGLVGQNGSGKSTLIKVLAGYHVPDPGAGITLDGQPVALPLGANQIHQLGLRFVHQDLGLVPSLSVLENFMVDELATSRRWHISWSAERRRVAGVLEEFGLRIDPRSPVLELAAADRAELAIVRAVTQLRRRWDQAGRSHGLLVLDEPTAFLPQSGRDRLFELIREVVARGDSVLFVSHYIEEVLAVTDRLTVLRDGQVSGTRSSRDLTTTELIELIVGRGLAEGAGGARDLTTEASTVTVSGLTGGNAHQVALEVYRGEVLGITGLLGTGFEDVPALLFGVLPAQGGTLTIEGRELALAAMSPERAVGAGVAFVPEDRDQAGGVGALTVGENLTLELLGRFTKGPYLDHRKMTAAARDLLVEYDVRPPDPAAKLADLSGGNQQKVILAKWLSMGPSLLLLHEPTHGVDVGSRQEILSRVRWAAQQGMAVICASSDAEQLADLCDRVLVFGGGAVVTQLVGEQVNKDSIVEQCYAAAARQRPGKEGN